MTKNSAHQISNSTAAELAALRQGISAARDRLTTAHRNFAQSGAGEDQAAGPFLDRCAQDLEDLARLCRSAADQAAQPNALRT